MSYDYEYLRQQLHNVRLENAEQRAKITKINREKMELQSALNQKNQIIEQLKAEQKHFTGS